MSLNARSIPQEPVDAGTLLGAYGFFISLLAWREQTRGGAGAALSLAAHVHRGTLD